MDSLFTEQGAQGSLRWTFISAHITSQLHNNIFNTQLAGYIYQLIVINLIGYLFDFSLDICISRKKFINFKLFLNLLSLIRHYMLVRGCMVQDVIVKCVPTGFSYYTPWGPPSPSPPPQNLTKLFILVFICQPFGMVLIS